VTNCSNKPPFFDQVLYKHCLIVYYLTTRCKCNRKQLFGIAANIVFAISVSIFKDKQAWAVGLQQSRRLGINFRILNYRSACNAYYGINLFWW